MEDGIQILQNAAECGDIDALYAMIDQNPDILKQMDDMEFVHTPLHVAAFNNQIGFAMELAMLKPSLARKLNTGGYSPMHLALQCGHVEVASSLLSIDTQLVRVKGRYGFTPLHYAAEIDESELVAEFLVSCPKSIEDLTSQCQTAVHVAVQNNSLKTLKILLQWLKRSVEREQVLLWKDAGGNTILHLAALANKPEAMELLIGCVKVNAKNLQGKTALDLIASQEQDGRSTTHERARKIINRARARQGSEVREEDITISHESSNNPFLSEPPSTRTNEIRNIMLVVAALIANATYQAVLNPPGGYWQDDSSTTAVSNNLSPAPAGPLPLEHVAGQMIISGPIQSVFVTANTLAFWLSISLILIFTAGLPYSWLVITTIWILAVTYMTTLYHNVQPQRQGDAIKVPALIFMGILCSLAQLYHTLLLYWRKQEFQSVRTRYTRRILNN